MNQDNNTPNTPYRRECLHCNELARPIRKIGDEVCRCEKCNKVWWSYKNK